MSWRGKKERGIFYFLLGIQSHSRPTSSLPRRSSPCCCESSTARPPQPTPIAVSAQPPRMPHAGHCSCSSPLIPLVYLLYFAKTGLPPCGPLTSVAVRCSMPKHHRHPPCSPLPPTSSRNSFKGNFPNSFQSGYRCYGFMFQLTKW